MISIKKGTINIYTERHAIDYCLDGSLLLLLCAISIFGGTEKGADYVYYVGFFSFLGLTLIKTIFEKKYSGTISIKLHTIWYGLFILLAITSSLWAFDSTATTVPLSRMIQILILGACVIKYNNTRENMERFLTILLLSYLVMSTVILIRTPFSDWFTGFVGKDVTVYNTNNIGLMASTGALIAFYKAYLQKERLFYLAAVLPVILVILTSSRKSLFMLVASITMLVLLAVHKKYYLIRIIVILAIVAATVLAIMKVPILYEAIGRRFESMFSYFVLGDTNMDSSIAKRELFIRMAKSYFAEHPFIGIGFNNFGARLRLSYEAGSYAHNNYWEIASGLGIIGFVTYYWFYAYLAFKLLQGVLRGKKLSILFFVYICLLIICEYGMVSYYGRSEQLMIALGFAVILIEENEPSYTGNENIKSKSESDISLYKHIENDL